MQNNGRRDGLQKPRMQKHATKVRSVFVCMFAFLGFAIRSSGHCFASLGCIVFNFGRFAVGSTCLGRCVRYFKIGTSELDFGLSSCHPRSTSRASLNFRSLIRRWIRNLVGMSQRPRFRLGIESGSRGWGLGGSGGGP